MMMMLMMETMLQRDADERRRGSETPTSADER
jgi:hypothetical protein